MKRLFTLFIISLAIAPALNAQVYFEEKKEQKTDSVKTSDFKERVYKGGNFSLNLGSDFTFIDISPLAGYMITPTFSAGLGAT